MTLAGFAPGAEYWLAPNGDDAAAGSREAPWRSIAKANEALGPGDVAVFAPGEYAGPIAPARQGEPGKPIRYRAPEPGKTVLTEAPGGAAIQLAERRHVAIEGFRIASLGNSWLEAENCEGLVIRDCIFRDNVAGYMPVSIIDSRTVRLIDNVFDRGKTSANIANLMGCEDVIVEGNAFTRVGHCPMRIEACERVVIRSNCFHNVWGRNYEIIASGRVLVEGNILTEALDSAGSADSRAKHLMVDSIIRFNRVFGNNHTPVNSNSFVPQAADGGTGRVREPARMMHSRAYHNVFADNLGFGWEMNGINVSDFILSNNIFFECDRHGAGIQVLMTDEVGRDTRLLHNLFRGEAANATTVRIGDSLLTAEEANRQSAVLQDFWSRCAGNIDDDPRFADAANRDFRIDGKSACVDAGLPLTTAFGAGKGRRLAVVDALPFYDGFGIEGEQGDWIAVGAGDNLAQVEKVEFHYYRPDVLVLDREMEWKDGAPVSLPWSGKAPDLGPYETGMGANAALAARAMPAIARPGESVRFACDASAGARLEWNFGDGARSAEREPEHAFAAPGQYPVRLLATYPDGAVRRDFAFVKVEAPRDPKAPMLEIDFEKASELEWGWRMKFERMTGTAYEFVEAPDRDGQCAHLRASGKGSILGAAISPGEWDIAAYPYIRFAYRIPPGTPVGLAFETFSAERYGEKTIMVGGTDSRQASGPDTASVRLIDDGQWREALVDARAIQSVCPDLRYPRRFRFHTAGNAAPPHQFWFDDFAILAK